MRRSCKKKFTKAVASGDLPRLRVQLDQGADPNIRTRNGETPLIMALHRWQVAAALLLLDSGADVHMAAYDGATALFWAARYGFIEVVLRLLSAGANVLAGREYRDCTPLAVAVSQGHSDVARVLIENGADPSQRYLGAPLTRFARDEKTRRVLSEHTHRCRR